MSHDDDMRALLYPLRKGLVSLSETGQILLVNPVTVPELTHTAPPDRTAVWQWWKHAADSFPAYKNFSDAPSKVYSDALVRLPRQREEAHFVMARAWEGLAEGGLFMAAAANDAGGRRLEDDLLPWLPELQTAVKHKCRITWARKQGQTAPQGWVQTGEMQKHPQTGYWTQPGLFSWDRIDPASAMLMAHIPAALTGSVADPGCGYGALSDYVLKHCPDVTEIICYDADARAIEACQRNIGKRHPERKAFFEWADFSSLQTLKAADHAVMNPPFHKDKATSVALGQRFITQAARMLRPGGDIYMVANSHLPYEGIMSPLFSIVEILEERHGFKIFYARR